MSTPVPRATKAELHSLQLLRHHGALSAGAMFNTGDLERKRFIEPAGGKYRITDAGREALARAEKQQEGHQ